MEKLNKIEIEILLSIISENDFKYPFLKEHFQNIYLINREYTGVGIYSNFAYHNEALKAGNINALISSEKTLLVKGLAHELCYVLDIEDGRIKYLEIVTNGNELIHETNLIEDFKLVKSTQK